MSLGYLDKCLYLSAGYRIRADARFRTVYANCLYKARKPRFLCGFVLICSHAAGR
jgi:hypothetical protein